MYYILEGYCSTGKTTVIRKLSKELEKKEYKVITVSEGGRSNEIKAINKINQLSVFDRTIKNIPTAQLFLFLAQRAIIIDEIIHPNNNSNTFILQDRSFISTLVHQGIEQHMGLEYTFRLNLENGLLIDQPNHIFVFDMDEKISFERLKNRKKNETRNCDCDISLSSLRKKREAYNMVINFLCSKGFEDKISKINVSELSVDDVVNHLIEKIFIYK